MRPPGLPEWIDVSTDTLIIHIIDDDGMFHIIFCFRKHINLYHNYVLSRYTDWI